MEKTIVVTYDGAYPVGCSGTLEITVDGSQIYSKSGRCRPLGCVSLTPEGEVHVSARLLVWDDASEFPAAVQAAVASKLGEISGHCGGCV